MNTRPDIQPPVADEVITAAAGAIWDVLSSGDVPVDKGQYCNLLARAALSAAAAATEAGN
jgi:hypothetical protein